MPQKRRDWKYVLDTRVKWRTWSGETLRPAKIEERLTNRTYRYVPRFHGQNPLAVAQPNRA